MPNMNIGRNSDIKVDNFSFLKQEYDHIITLKCVTIMFKYPGNTHSYQRSIPQEK